MIIKIDGITYTPAMGDPTATRIEMWYDRSRKNWVLYPVDANGYQIDGATYAFSKREALAAKRELEIEFCLR